jgi:MFS transporter, FHS family, L-fucose permease
LVMFAVGRFASTALMKRYQPRKLMGLYSLINILLVTLAITVPGFIGGYAIILSSFFMSLMFPTIFALGVKGLGNNTKLGGSMIIMAIIGGAVWTPLMGLIADRTHSMSWAYTIPLVSYLFITYYSYKGSVPSGPLSDEQLVPATTGSR